TREPGSPPVERDDRREGGKRAEGERQPAGEEVHCCGCAENRRSEPGVLAEMPARQRLEQRRGRRRGECRGELRRQRPGGGGEQQAVADYVVAGIPIVVPDSEGLSPEQLGAKEVRSQIETGRGSDHVGSGKRSRDGCGEEAAPGCRARGPPRRTGSPRRGELWRFSSA